MSRPRVLTGWGHGAPCAFVIGGDLYQTDWDYPAGASRCGWSIQRVQMRGGKAQHLARRPRHGCSHSGTDGTVDCRECGVTALDFIRAAGRFLDSIAEH